MNTMGFITHCLKNTLLSLLLCLCAVNVWAQAPADAAPAEAQRMRVYRADDAVYLSTDLKFELPSAVEDALLKGIPMVFVAEVEIYKDRWYWSNKRVVSATRTMRLAFQPLTRRWRLNVVSGAVSSTGLRAALGQNYATLSEALGSIRHLARWKIADASDVAQDAKHNLEFRFWLDLSQLPRPFQIGATGQKDWSIAIEYSKRLDIEQLKEEAVQ